MSSETREAFAFNVKARRVELGMTQVAFAEALGVAQPQVSDIENDRYCAGLDLVDRVAKALHTTADVLLRPIKPARKARRKSRIAT